MKKSTLLLTGVGTAAALTFFVWDRNPKETDAPGTGDTPVAQNQASAPAVTGCIWPGKIHPVTYLTNPQDLQATDTNYKGDVLQIRLQSLNADGSYVALIDAALDGGTRFVTAHYNSRSAAAPDKPQAWVIRWYAKIGTPPAAPDPDLTERVKSTIRLAADQASVDARQSPRVPTAICPKSLWQPGPTAAYARP